MPATYFQPDVIGYLNLTTKQFSLTPDGPAFTWPEQIQGDTLNVALRFTKEVEGVRREVTRDVRGLKASIGRIDVRPESGTFKIQVGPNAAAQVEGTNLTTAIDFDFSASTLQTALNALSEVGTTYGAATVTEDDETFIVEFDGETEAVELTIRTNKLAPVSFVQIRAEQLGDDWYHNLRLMRAPLAFTSTTTLAVPPPPTIETVLDGASDDSTKVNEVQELTVPVEFRGSYRLRRGTKRSTLLSRADGAEEIAQAINPVSTTDLRLGEDIDAEFTVTTPRFGVARIDFGGSMAGTDYDPMTVEVKGAPPGDLSFSLSLDKALVSEALRDVEELTVPFEIEIEFDELNVVDEYSKLTYRSDIVLNRELIWSELATVDPTDWQRGPVKATYVPSDGSEVEVGFANFPFLIGATTANVIDHDLDSDFVDVLMLDNDVPGKKLVEGTDFTLDRTEGKNSLGVTLIGDYDPAPGTGKINGMVYAFEEESRYSPHNQVIETITGETGDLRTILDGYDDAISALQAAFPTGVVTAADPDVSSVVVVPAFRPVWDVYPLRNDQRIARPEDGLLSNLTTEQLDPDGLGSIRTRLLRAVHQSGTPGDLPVSGGAPDTANMTANAVYKAATDVRIARGPRGTSITLRTGEFCVYNGTDVYQVGQYGAGTETSYYPTDFERELFRFDVNEKQLLANRVLTALFEMEMGLFLIGDEEDHAAAQWTLLIELGTYTETSSPATTGSNLASVVWNTSAPLLEYTFRFGAQIQRHPFGFSVTRAADGTTFTLLQSLYGGSDVGGGSLSTANFAVRGRLGRWDLEDAQTGPERLTTPRGLVGLSGLAFQDSNAGVGQAVISKSAVL